MTALSVRHPWLQTSYLKRKSSASTDDDEDEDLARRAGPAIAAAYPFPPPGHPAPVSPSHAYPYPSPPHSPHSPVSPVYAHQYGHPGPHLRKKRRVEVLENGLAHLSIGVQPAPAAYAPWHVPALASAQPQPYHSQTPSHSSVPAPLRGPSPPRRDSPPSSAGDGAYAPFVLSDVFVDAPHAEPAARAYGFAQEPCAPAVPEVKMSHSTWYEPEKDRIVVTDLASDSESEADAPARSAADADTPALPPAVLKRLLAACDDPRDAWARVRAPAVFPSSGADESRALVLFRAPPAFPGAFPGADAAAEQELHARVDEIDGDMDGVDVDVDAARSELGSVDEMDVDAMDVEP